MKIVVTYKWAADPQEASVDGQGAVDYSRAKPVVSDYDAVAIEVGRQLATATGAELVGVTVGGTAAGTPMATKAALSRGLDSAVAVADPELEGAANSTVATVLAGVVRDLGDVSLVITGDSSVDLGARVMPALLGGALGWPTLVDVNAVSMDGPSVTIEREVSEGRQTLSVEGPAVVAVTSGAASPKAPGMKDVMTAAKKPVRHVTAAEVRVTPRTDGTVRSRAKLSGPARKGIVIDGADPNAAATELIAALRAAGIQLGGQK